MLKLMEYLSDTRRHVRLLVLRELRKAAGRINGAGADMKLQRGPYGTAAGGRKDKQGRGGYEAAAGSI